MSETDISQLSYNFRDAVVIITGQFFDGVTFKNITGNGFFIRGRYIICPSSLILTIINNKRYRATRVLVDVSNVNENAYSYQADVIGIDGAGNIAVLKINMKLPWNHGNPPLAKDHPFFQLGKSRNMCPGTLVAIIGNVAPAIPGALAGQHFPAENGIVYSNIADNRYVYPLGYIMGELLLLSDFTSSTEGMPVISYEGKIVGMTLATPNLALSEYFMRRSIKSIIRYHQEGPSNPYAKFIQPVTDEYGSYLRFNKAWLGLAGVIMTQQDYSTTFDGLTRVPVVKDGVLTAGPSNKEIVGYRIMAIANSNEPTPQKLYTLGTPPTASPLPKLTASPLEKLLQPGDIITHINGCALGDRKNQISPTLVMWRVVPGTVVEIKFKRESEGFAVTHTFEVKTGSYDPYIDLAIRSWADPLLLPAFM